MELIPASRTLRPEGFPPCAPGIPRAVFLIDPDGFALAAESATDNAYMATTVPFDAERARRQAHELKRALSAAGIVALSFCGDPATPDAVFPNNVFATSPGRVVFGAMRHPVRAREAARADLRAFFVDVLGRRPVDLAADGVVAELTGSLVIDRARRLGWCGLSERCNRAGALAMHAAFDLVATALFELAASEYHTNVVLSALAGRGAVICPGGFASTADVAAIADFYRGTTVELDDAEKLAFAGNCIALGYRQLWLSTRAADGLRPRSRAAIEALGFALHAVDLDEIEKAGGSLRCMIGEIY